MFIDESSIRVHCTIRKRNDDRVIDDADFDLKSKISIDQFENKVCGPKKGRV